MRRGAGALRPPLPFASPPLPRLPPMAHRWQGKAVAVCIACCVVMHTTTAQLVGPGAMAPRTGGAGRQRSFGYVREPALGFFVAGSDIDDVNGVYFRVDPTTEPSGKATGHNFHLLYKSTKSNWLLGLAFAPEDGRYQTVGNMNTEWVFVDGQADRLAHEGETILPGAGDRWKHVRRPSRFHPGEFEHHHVDESMDNLPWQVVGIMDEERLRQLYNYQQHHLRLVRDALHAGESQRAALPAGGRAAHAPPSGVPNPPEALLEAEEAKDYNARIDALEADAIRLENEGMRLPGANGEPAMWTAAMRRLQAAETARRAREFTLARKFVEKSRLHFFRFDASFVEEGKLAYDQGDYQAALAAFARVLDINRNFDGLNVWLVRARAAIDRQKRLEEEAERRGASDAVSLVERETAFCIAWRQTGGCMPHGPREPQRDMPCDARIPAGNSGFCECRTHGGLMAPQANPMTCQGMGVRCDEACSAAFQGRMSHLQGTSEADTLVASAKQMEDSISSARAESLARQNSPSVDLVRKMLKQQYYLVLSLPCDFTAKELKVAFRKESLRMHPDKHGGSNDGFQIVSQAHDLLSDDERRRAFDEGEDLRTDDDDNNEREPYVVRVTKEYYPERFGFHPFGDPFERKRQIVEQERKRRELDEQRRNAAAAAIAAEEEAQKERERERRLDAMTTEHDATEF